MSEGSLANIEDEALEIDLSSLKDFKESPPSDYISVYTLVKKKNLESVAKEGLKSKYRTLKVPENAAILDRQIKEEAFKLGKTDFDRGRCIFARPVNPNITPPPEYYPEEGDMLLEIKVDPKMWVAEISDYEHAAISSEGPARLSFIKDYVEKSVRLGEYLLKQKSIPPMDTDFKAYINYIDKGGWPGFSNPEVLITTDVPNKFIRIAQQT